MPILNKLFFSALAALMLSSCTTITTTNTPGKVEKQIPKPYIGSFELQLPKEYQDLLGGEEFKMGVTFTAEEMILESKEGSSATRLGDSLYFSSIGTTHYLSLGEAPSFTVFKIQPKGKDIELFPVFAQQGVSSADLSPYFDAVEEITLEDGTVSYSVAINDQKLESFFSSPVSLHEPYLLKRVKKKKKK